MLLPKLNIFSKHNVRGDTIIEVLLAITIAAFAIGSSYAIASKSLQQGITAREHGEALNIAESQIAALKLRQQKTGISDFTSGFSYPVSHFCLDESATSPGPNWSPLKNGTNIGSDTPLVTGNSSDNYKAECQKNTKYFVDITTRNTGKTPPTVYLVTVRWERIGGGPFNETHLYYRF